MELIKANKASEANGIAKKNRISSKGKPNILRPKVYSLEKDHTPMYVNMISQIIKKEPTIRNALKKALKFIPSDFFFKNIAKSNGAPNTSKSIVK